MTAPTLSAEARAITFLPNGVERHPIVDRASWLALRMQDLTASDIAAVCGVDPHRSALRVWAEKTGAIAGTADNATLRRGRWLEAAVVEALKEEHPDWEIRRSRVYLRDPAIRFGATLDAVAVDPTRPGFGNIQCKVVRRDIYERDWEDGAPPIGFQLQTLSETILSGASWQMLAALVIDLGGGAEYVERPIERHQLAEDRIRAAVAKFWADTEAGIQPRVDPTRDAETVGELYAEPIAQAPLDLTTDNLLPGLLAEREALKGEIKSREIRVSEIDTEVKGKLGLHEAAQGRGWKVTWKLQHRGPVGPSDFRVLRVTASKT